MNCLGSREASWLAVRSSQSNVLGGSGTRCLQNVTAGGPCVGSAPAPASHPCTVHVMVCLCTSIPSLCGFPAAVGAAWQRRPLCSGAARPAGPNKAASGPGRQGWLRARCPLPPLPPLPPPPGRRAAKFTFAPVPQAGRLQRRTAGWSAPHRVRTGYTLNWRRCTVQAASRRRRVDSLRWNFPRMFEERLLHERCPHGTQGL